MCFHCGLSFLYKVKQNIFFYTFDSWNPFYIHFREQTIQLVLFTIVILDTVDS